MGTTHEWLAADGMARVRKRVPYSFTSVRWIKIRGYLFGYFSAEPPNEPAHIHVKGQGGTAKLFLGPVRTARSTYTRTVTREIERIVKRNEDLFLAMWHARHVDD